MPAQKMFALLFHKDSDINTGLSPGGTFWHVRSQYWKITPTQVGEAHLQHKPSKGASWENHQNRHSSQKIPKSHEEIYHQFGKLKRPLLGLAIIILDDDRVVTQWD
jgi:hypothetical protein